MEQNNTYPIRIIPMSRGEFSGKEKRLTINYCLVNVASHRYLIASTSKGICYLMPGEMRWEPIEQLKRHFPHAYFRCRQVELHRKAVWLLKRKPEKAGRLDLHLWGTGFQLAVWQDMLNIPSGMVTTYLNIARRIGLPKAARPVGGAVGSNPVMYLIPCHRVICTSGKLGGYRWGINRKIKFLNQEARTFTRTEGKSHWEPTLF